MIDRLLDFIIQFLEDILPCYIVKYYNRAVRLRFGKKFKGALEPGLHWKIPFVDKIYEHLVKPTTLDLEGQTVTTKDGVSIVVKGSLKYEVSDIVTLMLETNGATDALKDMSEGIIRDVLIEKEWKDCNDSVATRDMSEKIKREAKNWGIKVLQLRISTLAKMTSIRLLTSGSAKINLERE